MSSIFVIYLTVDGETTFSQSFATFSQAKNGIEPFLETYRQKKGKAIRYLSKGELEELKTPEDVIYIRKKTSQATLYHRVTHSGRFYNTYSLQKLGKLDINEFNIETVDPEPEVEKKQVTVENMSHGAHGNLLAELREKITKIDLKRVETPNKNRRALINSSEFIHALNSRKEHLNHVDPPVRQLIL